MLSFAKHIETSSTLVQGWRPTVRDELDACWATGRRYDTRAKYYLLPGNRCCPGLTVLSGLTSLPTCSSSSQRQLLLSSTQPQPLGAASFLPFGSEQLTGAWRVPVVGWLLPETSACWNWFVLHKLLARRTGGNNLLASVNLPLPGVYPRRCNRRQQRESRKS